MIVFPCIIHCPSFTLNCNTTCEIKPNAIWKLYSLLAQYFISALRMVADLFVWALSTHLSPASQQSKLNVQGQTTPLAPHLPRPYGLASPRQYINTIYDILVKLCTDAWWKKHCQMLACATRDPVITGLKCLDIVAWHGIWDGSITNATVAVVWTR